MKVGFSQGQVVIKDLDNGIERRVPFAEVEGISVFGMAQLSTQLVRECIANNVVIGYYSDDGHYFGSTGSFERIDPARQKRQMYLTDDAEFCLAWSRRVVEAKIRNSLALLECMDDAHVLAESDRRGLQHSLANLVYADSVDAAIGYEGNAAKCYFQCLAKLVFDDGLRFAGRSTRPPKDPFNSMLSYGYSVLYRNIIGAIERHGLHPYFAFMHKIKFGHASLASDLIEELRAPIVDKTVLELVNSGRVEPSDFEYSDSGAVYMTRATMKLLTSKLTQVIVKSEKYFAAYDDARSYGFQVMLDKKIATVIEAIEQRNPTRYRPYIWLVNR